MTTINEGDTQRTFARNVEANHKSALDMNYS
jgi:hypothetical protein